MSDDDKADWLHEVKRDKRLDRIAELENGMEMLGQSLKAEQQAADALRAQVAALEKDNDEIHGLVEWYRVQDGKLRELIREMDIEHDMGWWSRSVRDRIDEVLRQQQ